LVRPSNDDDVAGCAAIYAESVRTGTASWEYDAPDEAEIRRRRHAVMAAGYPWLVAELNGRVMGYSYASSYRARIGYRFTVENSVYVDPAAQGRGIGKALLQELIRHCQAAGYRSMIAVIGDSENEASIRLHTACGFTRVGTFPGIGFKFDRWLDSVQMLRAL
jgi:phosphinothricin acetyltransferase